MKKSNSWISEVVFFGAVWGILEASLGYVLHFLPTLLSGTVLFAVASFLLYRAYTRTHSKNALFTIGVIAAAIKALDFFLPAHPVYGYVKVINPMFCIVLEALVLALLLPALVQRKSLSSLAILPGASMLWRGLFIFYLIFQDGVFGTVSTQLSSFASGFTFVVLQGLISGGIALVLYGLNLGLEKTIRTKMVVKPVFAAMTLAVAVVLTLII